MADILRQAMRFDMPGAAEATGEARPDDGAAARQRIGELAVFVARLQGSSCVDAAHMAFARATDDEAWAATQAADEAPGVTTGPRGVSLPDRAGFGAAGMAALAVMLGIAGAFIGPQAFIGPNRAPRPAALPVVPPAMVAAPAAPSIAAVPAPPPLAAAPDPAPMPPARVLPVHTAAEPSWAPALVPHHAPPHHAPAHWRRRPAHPVRHVRRAGSAAVAR